jgi:hypothetical protein
MNQPKSYGPSPKKILPPNILHHQGSTFHFYLNQVGLPEIPLCDAGRTLFDVFPVHKSLPFSLYKREGMDISPFVIFFLSKIGKRGITEDLKNGPPIRPAQDQ